MDRLVDLDVSAAEIERRRTRWAELGLRAGPTTWREGPPQWPRRIDTDRNAVTGPDSVGVRLQASEDAEFSIVLFRAGFADFEIFDLVANIDEMTAPDIPTPRAFGEHLDEATHRLAPQTD